MKLVVTFSFTRLSTFLPDERNSEWTNSPFHLAMAFSIMNIKLNLLPVFLNA